MVPILQCLPRRQEYVTHARSPASRPAPTDPRRNQSTCRRLLRCGLTSSVMVSIVASTVVTALLLQISSRQLSDGSHPHLVLLFINGTVFGPAQLNLLASNVWQRALSSSQKAAREDRLVGEHAGVVVHVQELVQSLVGEPRPQLALDVCCIREGPLPGRKPYRHVYDN